MSNLFLSIMPLIVFVILSLASFYDFKYKKVPAVFMTGAIFAVAVFALKESLFFFLLSAILAYLLYDSREFSGIADIKAILLCGLVINSWLGFAFFVVTYCFISIIYKLTIRMMAKKKVNVNYLTIPFVPAITITFYIVMLGNFLSGGAFLI